MVKHLRYSWLAVVLVVITDQITKWLIRDNYFVGERTAIIDGFFNITYVRNPGAAFGFMATASEPIRKIMLLMIPVIVCIGLVYFIWYTRNGNKLFHWAYTLIFAGAVGNLIDRFTLGYVVDFLDFYIKESHYPAFNVADSCITVAASLLIFDFVLQLRQQKQDMSNQKS